MDKPAAATPASPTSPAAPAQAEPGLAELAKIINFAPAPAAATKKDSKPRAQAAQPAEPDLDPDLAENPDVTAAEEPAEPEAGADPAAEGAEEPAAGEETAEETTTETAAPEGLDEEDLATRKSFNAEQQKAFDKAVQKKHAKVQELSGQVQNLTTELEQARATPPAPATPTPDNPLADVDNEQALDKRLAEVRNLRRWALTHPDGGTIKDGATEHEITKERVAEMVAETEELLQEFGPKRREFIRQTQAIEAQALQDYPWLKSKTSHGTVAVESMLRTYGNTRLRDIPGIRAGLADLFIGQIIRAQGKQKAAKPAGGAQPPKAPATPAGHRPPPKVAGPTKQAAVATKTLETTGADPGNATLSSLISRKR